jgi:hypothetical protein
MDFILRLIETKFARLIVAVVLLGGIFALTLYLLMPRGGHYRVEVGPASLSGSQPRDSIEEHTPATPAPIETPLLTDSSTSADKVGSISPSATPAVVTLEPAGVSSQRVDQIYTRLVSSGYAVKKAPAAPSVTSGTVIKFRPSAKAVAESIRRTTELTNARLVEDPGIPSDVWIVLGVP